MTLIKSIAGYFKEYEVEILNEDGSISHKEKRRDWIDQIDIEMHELEECATLKSWAIHEYKIKVPNKPSQSQEHDWLIEFGPDYVKQKRKEWQESFDAAQPDIEAAEQEFQKAHADWNEHADLCRANGLCPDSHQGDARLTLTQLNEGTN